MDMAHAHNIWRGSPVLLMGRIGAADARLQWSYKRKQWEWVARAPGTLTCYGRARSLFDAQAEAYRALWVLDGEARP